MGRARSRSAITDTRATRTAFDSRSRSTSWCLASYGACATGDERQCMLSSSIQSPRKVFAHGMFTRSRPLPLSIPHTIAPQNQSRPGAWKPDETAGWSHDEETAVCRVPVSPTQPGR